MFDERGALGAAVAHPVRLRILSMLTAQPMSAAEVARELDLTHANASYRLRVLHAAGELVVESEQKRCPPAPIPTTPSARSSPCPSSVRNLPRRTAPDPDPALTGTS